MDNIVQTIISLAVGAVLGVVFYAGLWITVRQLLTSSHAGMLIFGSLWLRLALVLAGFLFVLHGRWQNALAYLTGVAASRIATSRFLTCR
jgi:F1F0 ATPase subunit 2